MSRTTRANGTRDGRSCSAACIIFTTDGVKVRYDKWNCDVPAHKRRTKQRTHQMFRRTCKQNRYEDR